MKGWQYMPRKAKSKKIKAVEKVRKSDHVRSVSTDSGIYPTVKLTFDTAIN